MIELGIDRLFKDPNVRLGGKRVGLLVHAASVNSKFVHTIDILYPHSRVHLVKLFSPEHGLWGTIQDMVSVDSNLEPQTELPLKSLYGSTLESLTPTHDDLLGIDVLVCDLQDIGTRYYTYAATVALCLKACAKADKEVIILDRPNPLNGLDIEGPLLEKGYESFVGLYPIPVRHGMTLGELALFYNQEHKIGCRLHVVKMKGWKRNLYFDETNLPWVLPSPNMPTLDTALVYPGLCLLEATNVSEGRGTTKPFELVGAPFMDPHALSEALHQLKLPEIIFRPHVFSPTFQKWAGLECRGVQLHVTNRKKFKPFLTGIALLKTIHDLYPNDFKWRDKPYEFISDIPAIDLLYGSNKLREQLSKKTSFKKIQARWEHTPKFFSEKRMNYLLYEEC